MALLARPKARMRRCSRMTCARPGPRVLAGAVHRPPNRPPTAPNRPPATPPTPRGYREFTIAAMVPGTARIMPARCPPACLAYHGPSAAHRPSPGARQPSANRPQLPANQLAPVCADGPTHHTLLSGPEVQQEATNDARFAPRQMVLPGPLCVRVACSCGCAPSACETSGAGGQRRRAQS